VETTVPRRETTVQGPAETGTRQRQGQVMGGPVLKADVAAGLRDMHDRAERIRLALPQGWRLVSLANGECRYALVDPDGFGRVYLHVPETEAAFEALFGPLPPLICQHPDGHGSPMPVTFTTVQAR
jgi:hypothetical protein